MSESRVMERVVSGESEAGLSRVIELAMSGEMGRVPIFEVFIFYYLKDMPDEPEAGEIDRQRHPEDEDTDGDFFN